MSVTCFKCSNVMDFELNSFVSRQDMCSKCHSAIHCCKMCQHYDVNIYNQCRETQADRVVDKEKSNFCDYFSLSGQKKSTNPQADLLAKANELFKK